MLSSRLTCIVVALSSFSLARALDDFEGVWRYVSVGFSLRVCLLFFDGQKIVLGKLK